MAGQDEVERVLRRVEVGLTHEPAVSCGFWLETVRRMNACQKPDYSSEAFGEGWRALAHTVAALTYSETAGRIAARQRLPGVDRLDIAHAAAVDAARIILPLVQSAYSEWKVVAPAAAYSAGPGEEA